MKGTNKMSYTKNNTKTRKVHVRADGSRYPLHFSGGLWWWDHGCGSFPQSGCLDGIREGGGHIEVEPNPNYRPRRKLSPAERLLKDLFGR